MAPPVRKLPEGYALAAGYHRGHKVTKHKVEKPFRQRPSRLSSKNKHAKFVRDLIREVAGLQPYEKRVIELLKIGKDKRALKFIKRRLGNHSRSKKKRDELQAYLQASKRTKA
ncbi:unnamed protein product [Brachionus calyciflorus]|uniref:60S ribosomal protein L36 n=1 Tax=Brachionus calyciflorus TaxID=104777 RepID=A0A813QJE5_9BILA|nr:unnamed protein product [Brachionus calyciflorus]